MKQQNWKRRRNDNYAGSLLSSFTLEETEEAFRVSETPLRQKQPRNPFLSQKQIDKRWQVIENDASKDELLDQKTLSQMDSYRKNIENFIGTVKLPVGLVGPLRVNGLFAKDDFYIPLATTEAALVASYNRGAQLISEAGGACAMLVDEGVTRTPGFVFENLVQSGQFVAWVTTQYANFIAIAEGTTNHGKLIDTNMTIEGNHVFLEFEYRTGDASGQNMVTIATNAVYNYILKESPVRPKLAFLDANLSGDKKATAQTMRGVRGKKVTVEAHIPGELIRKRLHTDAARMAEFTRVNTVACAMSGTIGIQGHYSNALAALYIACGQDAACVAESAVGITRMELKEDGGLYSSVTLPNLMVGTVGGGTALPSQKACLDILGLHGSGNAKALAEVAATLCLCGELLIVGAFCADHFSRAHDKLART